MGVWRGEKPNEVDIALKHTLIVLQILPQPLRVRQSSYI